LLPGLTLAEVVQKLKANASRRLGENGVQFKRPKGYGALSASPFFPPTVEACFHNQAEHHKKRSFREEFLALLF
jgi:putative transposase